MEKKRWPRIGKLSFWMGVASIFLATFWVFPIIAVVAGILSLVKEGKDENNKVWPAVTGLILGVLYTLVAGYMEIS